jgi:hypothetical protein
VLESKVVLYTVRELLMYRVCASEKHLINSISLSTSEDGKPKNGNKEKVSLTHSQKCLPSPKTIINDLDNEEDDLL